MIGLQGKGIQGREGTRGKGTREKWPFCTRLFLIIFVFFYISNCWCRVLELPGPQEGEGGRACRPSGEKRRGQSNMRY